MRRMRAIDEVLNEVYLYGGFPLRLGDIITDMDKTAKQLDKNNWFSIREAGLAGLMRFNRWHPLEGAEPISLERFYEITEISR